MGHLSQHKARISSQVSLGVNDLSKGMIALISYKSVLNETSLKMCLIVSPKFKDEVHILDLDVLSVKRLHELVQFTNEKAPSTKTKSGREYSYIAFDKSGKQLYENVMKKFVTQRAPDSYKTLKREGVKTVFGILYKWDAKWLPVQPKKFDTKIIEQVDTENKLKETK